MSLEFIELDLEWPFELSVFDLKDYILSKLMEYGEPLRWSITSLTNDSGKTTQKICIEAILIMSEDKKKEINTYSN